MKLHIGDPAPDFQVKDIYNKAISLSDYRGKKLLLSFYRNVACPFCNLRVHQLGKLHPTLQAQGLEMLFFFETPKKHILLSSFHSGLSPISIVGDPEKHIYKLYGVENSLLKSVATLLKSGAQEQLKEAKALGLDKFKDDTIVSKVLPADFLIDEQGIVRELYYGTATNDHLPIQQVKDFAALASAI